MDWIERESSEVLEGQLAENLGIPKLLARLLLGRGFQDSEQVGRFLKPKLAHLSDPFFIPGMEEAVKRILDAKTRKQKALIIGDYDVDGITSISMVSQALNHIGIECEQEIPKRLEEGYGLSKAVIDRGLAKNDFDLVIALDCGTNSLTEATYLKKLKIDLIIIDHHQLKGSSRPEGILLNPHAHPNSDDGSRIFCTAGLCFKFIHALFKRMRELDHEGATELSPREFLPLCALGTLADLVPLRGENRILSWFGLKRIFLDSPPGLLALLNESGIDETSLPETEDLTFKVAPRINACGRLNQPETALELLLASDDSTCRKLARQTTILNTRRKEIEATLTEEALRQAHGNFSQTAAAVAYGSGPCWHPGVVGIVAGKLANSLNKPCLVLAQTAEGDFMGSGRSAQGIDLVRVLESCKCKLKHWGGHPAAVGLGVSRELLQSFIKEFLAATKRLSLETGPETKLVIDSYLEIDEIDESLLEKIGLLAPFGQENPEPILALKNIFLAAPPRKIGNGEHFQFSISQGYGQVRGIAWRMSDRMPSADQPIDLAFRLRRNSWKGSNEIQLVLEDWNPSKCN